MAPLPVEEESRTNGSRPQVIVNSVCTGNVRTEIGRPIADIGWAMKLIASLYVMIVGKTPDHGARHVIKASLLPKEAHVSGPKGQSDPSAATAAQTCI